MSSDDESSEDDSSTISSDTNPNEPSDLANEITDTDVFYINYKKLVAKLKTELSVETNKQIVKLTNEIAQLKSQLNSLESKVQQQNTNSVPNCVLGMFYDWEFQTEKTGETNEIKVSRIKPIDSKLLEWTIDTKEITIPYSRCLVGVQTDKQFQSEKIDYCYGQLNYYVIEMFYNLEKLTIPTDLYFKTNDIERLHNLVLPDNSGAFENIFTFAFEHLNKYYDYSRWYTHVKNSDLNFCNLTLPKLKSLHLIGNTTNCVFTSVQPLMETISITEYDFEYKLKPGETIGSISIDINKEGLKFWCPFHPDSSDELDVVLRTQFPKLKTIEYNFHTVKTDETEEYLVRLSSALKRYYKKLGLEVEINIY